MEPVASGISQLLDLVNSLRARCASLEAERDEAVKAQRIVQNAAKTLASAQGTELQYLRQNAAYDHKIRSEHESLLERDALMTEALEAAEARATRSEAMCADLAKALESARKKPRRQPARLTPSPCLPASV